MFDGLSDDRGRDEPHHRGNFSSNVGSVNSSSGSLTKIDLFSLYVLFCLFRPRYVHQGICLLSYHKLCIQYVHMTSFEKKKTVFWGTITWPEMGKQNIQAKKSIKDCLRR